MNVFSIIMMSVITFNSFAGFGSCITKVKKNGTFSKKLVRETRLPANGLDDCMVKAKKHLDNVRWNMENGGIRIPSDEKLFLYFNYKDNSMKVSGEILKTN